MPFGDGTGPNGLGPMTGRGAGYCAGYGTPGYMNPIPGRGYFGRSRGFFGRGGGRGRRNWYYATGLPGWNRVGAGLPAWGGYPVPPLEPELSPQNEAVLLKEQVSAMEKEIKEIHRYIADLEKLAAEEKAEEKKK